MKNLFLALNILLISLISVGDIFYILYGTLVIKSITSAGFVLLGIVNLVYALKNNTSYKKFAITMAVGLFFAMLGDILLEIEFIIGALLFAVGHIFYFVAYGFIIKFKLTDLIYGAIIFVPSVLFITLAPIFDFGGVTLEILCCVYAVVISCMVGKAISNLIQQKTLLNLMIVVGSCLFFFSDLMLLLNVFGNLSSITGVLCLATYYPAECILAVSIALSLKHSTKQQQ